jgi:hypothetical protein
MRTVLGLVGGSVKKKAAKHGFRKMSKKTIILPQDMDVAEKEWRIQKQQKKEGALSFSALEMETGEYGWQLAPPPHGTA